MIVELHMYSHSDLEIDYTDWLINCQFQGDDFSMFHSRHYIGMISPDTMFSG